MDILVQRAREDFTDFIRCNITVDFQSIIVLFKVMNVFKYSIYSFIRIKDSVVPALNKSMLKH